MKTVLVTGGDGQLATCIKQVVKNVEDKKFVFKNSTELNITSKAELNSFFADNSIDYCINSAAYTAVDKAESNSKLAFEINSIAVKKLAQVCKENQTVLIHISTDFVFDGTNNQPYKELDISNPKSVYGASKLQGEKEIQLILKEHFIIRTSWLYSEFGNNFMKTMLRLSKERKNLEIVNDQIGTPTYAIDLANVVLKIINEGSKEYGIYHYSNEGSITWYDFAKEIFKQSDIEISLKPILTKEYPTPVKRPIYSVLDTTKIKETFQIKIPNWKESLGVALNNFLKNYICF
jgi:dTDP-4-dehydrorhamnose reductase